MNDSAVDRAIDKTHLRTTKRIVPHVKRQHPNVTEQQIKAVNKTRPKDSYSHDPQRYYYPVFANHHHAFQMDLLEQSRERPDTFPAYFLILINVNTRYAHAIPTERKTKEAINEILTEFINAHAITSIVCDDERAFTSKLVLDTLTSHNVSIRIITEQRHSALSIVDRFIRTLRDMNTPTVKSQHQSTHPKYRDFSIKRMNKLLNIYNHTVHGSTNHTPAEMEQDPNLETEYITEKLYQLERRRKQKDFELKPDTYVRYILPKDPHTKSRFKVSPEAYRISHREGNAYVLIAQDGTIKTVPRWRIIPLGSTLPAKLKFSSSFGNNNGTVRASAQTRVVVQEILSYNPRTRKYTVQFSMPDGSTYEDTIPESFLRGSTPQIQAEIEREFHRK